MKITVVPRVIFNFSIFNFSFLFLLGLTYRRWAPVLLFATFSSSRYVCFSSFPLMVQTSAAFWRALFFARFCFPPFQWNPSAEKSPRFISRRQTLRTRLSMPRNPSRNEEPAAPERPLECWTATRRDETCCLCTKRNRWTASVGQREVKRCGVVWVLERQLCSGCRFPETARKKETRLDLNNLAKD